MSGSASTVREFTTTAYRDEAWMILTRGPLEIELFPHADLDPWRSSFSACVRVADVDALHAAWSGIGLPNHGIPRLGAPVDQPFGLRMGHLVDGNGNLLRLIGPLAADVAPRTP